VKNFPLLVLMEREGIDFRFRFSCVCDGGILEDAGDCIDYEDVSVYHHFYR